MKEEDFKKAAKEKNIIRWNIHDCSMCGYPCGYIINGDEVSYDSGCDCVSYSDIHSSSWGEMVDHYNNNEKWSNNPTNEKPELTKKAIKEMDEFWGFKDSQGS